MSQSRKKSAADRPQRTRKHRDTPRFRPNRDVDGNGRTNEARALRAEKALVEYIGSDRRDDDDQYHLQDLLCDLMHLADMRRLNFKDAVEMGHHCYLEER